MTDREKKLFAGLCLKYRAEEQTVCIDSGIGTYKEKRLHRILKEFVSGDPDTHEIEISSFVADVLVEDHITEIQTGSFRPLIPKLEYYLNDTEYKVTVIYPIIAERMIYRIDPETGEILRRRRSPLRKDFFDLLCELYYARDIFPHERLEIKVILLRAEEHRYSDRIRYRKEGAYVSELFPTELIDIRSFCKAEELSVFLPTAESFSAKEYSEFIGRKGRTVYSFLNLLCYLGVLERRKDGRRYIYRKLGYESGDGK